MYEGVDSLYILYVCLYAVLYRTCNRYARKLTSDQKYKILEVNSEVE